MAQWQEAESEPFKILRRDERSIEIGDSNAQIALVLQFEKYGYKNICINGPDSARLRPEYSGESNLALLDKNDNVVLDFQKWGDDGYRITFGKTTIFIAPQLTGLNELGLTHGNR